MLHRQFTAGGVVYKKNGKNTLWLVRKTVANKDYPNSQWRLPKGWLDDENEGPGPLTKGDRKATEKELQNAALREIAEEAGVKARIEKKIGTIRFFFTDKKFGKILKFVTFYLAQWVSDLPEGFGFETDEIRWLSFDKAQKILSIASEAKVLEKANASLNSGEQSSLL